MIPGEPMNEPHGLSGPKGTARNIFVSYARADRKRALPVIRLLENAGYNIWWDGLLEGGETYLKATEDALEGADVVVVLWSRTSVISNWVRDEAMSGRDRRCLVPLSLDGSEPPLGFRQFQMIDIVRWRGKPAAPEASRILSAVDAQANNKAYPADPPAGVFRPSRRALIGAAAVLGSAGALGGAWALWNGRGAMPDVGQLNSVAVIPFHNLSGNPAQAYLSDGLSEEVRTVLAQNSLLKVVAQGSAINFRESAETAQEMAKKLGVAFVLTGSVRTADGMLRIAARLTDGETGQDAWAQSFDRPSTDLLSAQTEIANRVADALTAQIGANAAARARAKGFDVRKGGTRNPAALDAYLRGRSLYYFGISETDERAGLRKFEEAIALDPNFAAARAERARAIPYIADQYGKPEALLAAYDAALAEARQSVRLAPDLADAHSALGYLLFTCFLNAKAARAPFEKSLQLAPGEEAINSYFARYSALMKRDGPALKAAELALALSPLDASVHRGLGRVHFWARRYSAAISPLQQALKMSPGLSNANSMIGTALQMMGRIDEALAYHQREPARVIALTGIAITQFLLGDKAEAQAAFNALIGEFGSHALYQQAQVLAQWGDRDGAIRKLQEALPRRDSGLVFLLTDPMIDPLRPDARFADLLFRIGMD